MVKFPNYKDSKGLCQKKNFEIAKSWSLIIHMQLKIKDHE